MNKLRTSIDEIEKMAAESELIGALATDPRVRDYNKRLTIELREHAQNLRAQLLTESAEPLEGVSVQN